jgi:hypothetical protein
MSSKSSDQKPKLNQSPWFRSLKSKSQSDLTRSKKSNAAAAASAAITAENRDSQAGGADSKSNSNSNDQNTYMNRNNMAYSSFRAAPHHSKYGNNARQYGNNQPLTREQQYLESKSTNDFFSPPVNHHVTYRNPRANPHAANRIQNNENNGYESGASSRQRHRNQEARIQSIYLDDDVNLASGVNSVNTGAAIIITEHEDAGENEEDEIRIPVVAYLVDDNDEGDADDENGGEVVVVEDEEPEVVELEDGDYVIEAELSDDWDNMNEDQRKNDDLIDSLKRQIDYMNMQLSEVDREDASFLSELTEKIENIAQINQVSLLFIFNS